MSCPDENVLTAFMGGRLPDPQRRAVERHLDGCASCAGAVAAVARAVDPHASTALANAPTTERLPGAPQRPGSEPPPTSRVGRYELLGELGRGGMGVVYAARDPALDRPVALKLLRSDFGAASGAARLVREARALARVSHPNVVAVYDVGEEGGRVFVAMELVRGYTLREWQARAPRSVEQVVDLFLQAGRGLAAAHAAGLLHRDFKPENVLVGDDGRVRVSDFGLARLLAGEAGPGSGRMGAGAVAVDRALTAAGTVMGTPAYMAPEQLRGEPVGPACDQFAFCVTLYEALWGGRPYGDANIAALRPELTHAARPVGMVPGSAWIFDLVARGLDLDPRRRHAGVQVILDGLARGLRPTPIDSHMRTNAVLQSIVSFLHFTVTGVLFWGLIAHPGQSSGPQPPPWEQAKQDPETGVALGVAVLLALLLFCGWLPLGGIWTAVNSFGLWRNRRWAVWSTVFYAFLSLPTCLGTPYAIYALFTLFGHLKKKRDLGAPSPS
jgi:serine/threonine protein kinase